MLLRAVYQADTYTQVLPSLVGARSQQTRIHGTQKMFVQGKLFELQALSVASRTPLFTAAGLFVIADAINGDWLTMFAAILLYPDDER